MPNKKIDTSNFIYVKCSSDLINYHTIKKGLLNKKSQLKLLDYSARWTGDLNLDVVDFDDKSLRPYVFVNMTRTPGEHIETQLEKNSYPGKYVSINIAVFPKRKFLDSKLYGYGYVHSPSEYHDLVNDITTLERLVGFDINLKKISETEYSRIYKKDLADLHKKNYDFFKYKKSKKK